MEVLTLKRQSTFKDLEIALKELQEKDISSIKIPISFEAGGVFGVEGLALLLLATWMRKNSDNRTVIVPIGSVNEFTDVCSTFYGICALRYATKINTSTEFDIPLSVALGSAYESFRRIVAETFDYAFKDGYLVIPSFKAKGKNSEYLSPFYDGEKLVSDDQFNYLTKIAIQSVLNQTGKKIDFDKRVKNISAVVRELFGNTHKHARSDHRGNVLLENFRAVIFNQKQLSQERLNQLIGAGGGALTLFGSYWQNKGSLSLLDITVVDSGPGYAKRWIKDFKDISIDDEKTAIVACFTKHQSSDGKESSGSGLTNVLRDLKSLKGWFMLRTGNVIVEKSFLFDADEPKITLADVKVAPYSTEGVSFNIVIPLNELQEQ